MLTWFSGARLETQCVLGNDDGILLLVNIFEPLPSMLTITIRCHVSNNFRKSEGKHTPLQFCWCWLLSTVTKIDWVGWRRGDRWVVEPWICAGRERMGSTQQRAGEAGESKQQVWRINSACLSEDCQSLPDDGQSGCSQSICRQVGEQRASEPWRRRTQTIWRGSAGAISICCCHAGSAQTPRPLRQQRAYACFPRWAPTSITLETLIIWIH